MVVSTVPPPRQLCQFSFIAAPADADLVPSDNFLWPIRTARYTSHMIILKRDARLFPHAGLLGRGLVWRLTMLVLSTMIIFS
jgi:hypothetical protein